LVQKSSPSFADQWAWCSRCGEPMALGSEDGKPVALILPPAARSRASQAESDFSRPHRVLRSRLTALAGLFAAEVIALSVWLDTGSLTGARGLTAIVAVYSSGFLRFLTAAALFVLVFGGSHPSTWVAVARDRRVPPIEWRLLLAHAGLLVLFAKISATLFGTPLVRTEGNVLTGLWILTGSAAAVLAADALVPVAVWAELFVRLRPILWFALGVSAGSYAFGWVALHFWQSLSEATLAVAYRLLHPFIAGLQADAATGIIGGSRFRVEISAACSGFDGLGLVLAFTAAWLWFHRSEWRFPRAFVLIPIGLAAIWIANCVRIAALVFIGEAISPAIATGGFHSEAGWFAFTAVAFGIGIGAHRLPWLLKDGNGPRSAATLAPNPVAVYLVPFLTTLGAAALVRIVSDDFQWLYPIQVVAAAGALWHFRGEYRSLRWRVSWRGPALGVLVFTVWVLLEPLAGTAVRPVPAALGRAAEPWRAAWVMFRVLGAVVTVPIGEELAFRGYLLRRFVSADFEAVEWASVSWFAILMSAAGFGVLHGERWLAGTIAGVIYAVAVVRRGSIGEGVAAHATTNALIAAWIAVTGDWRFW